MCGIVGYIGTANAEPILVTGLKRLEYRGYDSAGIVTIEDKDFKITKVEGKVVGLTERLSEDGHSGSIGIGHTRWATHGIPSELNAHPHQAGNIVLVHNGIIENFYELKEELEADGVKILSETDTEILGHLINIYHEEEKDLHLAVERALNRVRGTFGIAVMSSTDDRQIVVARRGSPLLVGTRDDEIFVGSDASAVAGFADDIIYLDDDEIAVCTPGKVEVFDLKHQEKQKESEKLEMDVAALQKQGYDHFLIKEIMEQPDSVRETLRGHTLYEDGTARLGGVFMTDEQIRDLERVITIACGTAFYAGMLSKYLLERMAGFAVDVEVASEFRYREPVLSQNSAAIIISQSGETADTLASLKELKQRGVYTHGVVNTVGSTIAREVDGGTYLHVGPEVSVASTKAFTSMVVAQMLFGLYLARRRGLSLVDGQNVVRALNKLPEELEEALKLDKQMKKIAKDYAKYDHAMYLGRDTLFPVALEGALKLKEVSYIHAEAYAGGEMKHGPIALIDDKFFVVYLLGKGHMYEKSKTNLEELKARGANLLVITDSKKYKEEDPDAIYVKTTSYWTAPLLFNIPLQLLAYYISVARGTDVDQPRNLAKSVTVE